MKDLKVVIAIAVPLVLVAGGLYFLQDLLGPEGGTGVVSTSDVDMNARPRAGVGEPVPRDQWPKEPGAGVGPSRNGLPEIGEREPFDGSGETPTLTVDELKRLLAIGDAKSFQRIRTLMLQGLVEEPFEVAELLMANLDKGDNHGIWMGKLLVLLKDDQVKERIAANLLETLGEFETRDGLVAAIEVVGKVGGPENVAALAGIARGHEKRDAVARALDALADIGGAEAATELAAFLKDNAGNQDRLPLAMRAIENLKTNDMVNALGGLLAKDQPQATRILGVQALGRAAGTEVASRKLLEIWKAGGETGRAAGTALGDVRGEEATKPFLGMIDDVDDPIVKANMTKALATNPSEESKKKLEKQLLDLDERQSVRGASAASLAELGDARGLPTMVEIISSPRQESALLDRKVIDALPRLAARNRAAAQQLVKTALPILRKRMKDNPTGMNGTRLRVAIVALEAHSHGIVKAPE